MNVIPLSEGSFTVDASKKFIPFLLSEDELSERKKGSLLVEVQPFVVVTKKDVILLDTGLGLQTGDGQFQLYKNLLSTGIQPDAITKVLVSHLHKDHAGGLVNPYTKMLSFDNATYYIQQIEMDYALQKGAPSYDIEILDIVQSANQVVFLQNDSGIIDDYITYEVTHAHSKYHQVFWIKEGSEIIFFGADDAPQYAQMKHRFAAKYDYDGKKAMELREKWWSEGRKQHWKFLFYHDISTPFCNKDNYK